MTQPVTPVQQEFSRVSSASWTMLFPFQAYNGGQGVSLACTGTSSRVKLLGEFGPNDNRQVNIAVVVNIGSVFAQVRTETIATGGSPSVSADSGSMAVPPGGAIIITLPGATDATDVYLAGIAPYGSTTLQITTGFGN